MIFKHKNNLTIIEVTQEDQIEFYLSNPIWQQVLEDTTKLNGVYSNLSKDDLLKMAHDRSIGASVHHTKEEIINMLEKGKYIDMVVLFDDNLIN